MAFTPSTAISVFLPLWWRVDSSDRDHHPREDFLTDLFAGVMTRCPTALRDWLGHVFELPDPAKVFRDPQIEVRWRAGSEIPDMVVFSGACRSVTAAAVIECKWDEEGDPNKLEQYRQAFPTTEWRLLLTRDRFDGDAPRWRTCRWPDIHKWLTSYLDRQAKIVPEERTWLGELKLFLEELGMKASEVKQADAKQLAAMPELLTKLEGLERAIDRMLRKRKMAPKSAFQWKERFVGARLDWKGGEMYFGLQLGRLPYADLERAPDGGWPAVWIDLWRPRDEPPLPDLPSGWTAGRDVVRNMRRVAFSAISLSTVADVEGELSTRIDECLDLCATRG